MNSSRLPADPSPWIALESVPDLCAMPAAWQAWLGSHYPAFRERFLRPNPGLAHLAGGVCPLHFSWGDFGPALARAFHCTPLSSRELAPHTRQVGAWSCEATPVFLTCCADAAAFEFAIARLCARLHRRFIVFAPSKRFLNAECLVDLDQRQAAVFALGSCLCLTASGELQPTVLPGELLAGFTPAPGGADEEAAARAFALVRQLDADAPAHSPSVYTVFRLYCAEALSLAQVARRCGCSKATVYRRLQDIHRRSGVPPERLRTWSPRFAELESAVQGRGGRPLHARSLIYDDAASDRA